MYIARINPRTGRWAVWLEHFDKRPCEHVHDCDSEDAALEESRQYNRLWAQLIAGGWIDPPSGGIHA